MTGVQTCALPIFLAQVLGEPVDVPAQLEEWVVGLRAGQGADRETDRLGLRPAPLSRPGLQAGEVVVVEGAYELTTDAAARIVRCADWERGPGASIRCGLAALAGQHGVSVSGGNITRTPGPLVVDVTAGGSAKPRRWLTRSGARPGDELYVSG